MKEASLEGPFQILALGDTLMIFKNFTHYIELPGEGEQD